MTYERDPARIYAASFATVRQEARLDRFPDDVADLVVRMIHACGMVDIADDIAFSTDCVAAGRAALVAGAPVLCDTDMVASGVIRRGLAEKADVVSTIGDPAVTGLAKNLGTTRSAAAVELWRTRIAGSVVAVGNAPTAL
ncbi:MAG: precorrin-8X methylmutase, partial [Rhodobiaceae bacterium]|nr:precorrin-8X methylmutase [Rhodobiaceae bacterium]